MQDTMSGFENGFISLDEERNVYYAGQIINGRIEFVLSQPLVFTEIKVEFHGEGRVHWEEEEIAEYNGIQRKKTVEYGAREEYINVVHCVCGGVGVSELPAGSHAIPFCYKIPLTAPSTFRGGDIAEIRYWVKACLQYPGGRPNAELEKAFEVVVPLDLNLDEEMKRPLELEFEQAAGSCLCGARALGLRARLPARGFCPAQRATLQVAVHNRTAQEIRKLLFQLVQRENYRSHLPMSSRSPPEKVLSTGKLGPILAKTNRSYTYEFAMPDIIAPVLDNCGIIDVGFFFKVKLKMSGCADDQEDEAEIRLGLVPLYEFSNGKYVHPLQSDLPKGPIPHPHPIPELAAGPQSPTYPSTVLERGILSIQVAPVASPRGSPGLAPYPGFNAPYPGVEYPYTGSAAPYPTGLPTPPPPYAPAPIGFTVPASPEHTAAPSPYNPAAPPS